MSALALIALAFLCGFLMDLVWTLCIDAVTRKKPVSAANYSAALYLCTIVSTVLIVEKCFIAVVAYIIGGWIGTYIIVSRRKHV
jgi:hypothetical protein